MRRGSMIGLLVAIGAVGVYGAVSWVFADRLVGPQFPSPGDPVDFAALGLPEPESVTIANGPTELAAWYFANPAAAGCAVIQVHGFSGQRAEVVGAAPLFWDLGCDILVYDLRGHGRSSPGLLTYGAHDKFDELAAVDWLTGRTGLPRAKIGLMGWSYGAATSIQAAAERPGLAFVIADASYSSVSDIAGFQAEQQFGAWARAFLPGALLISGLRAGFDPADASPALAIAQVTDPVLLITSTTDEFTPYQHSEAIHANGDPSRTRLELTRWGAPHAMSYPTDPTAYTQIVDAFLADFVPGFGTARALPSTAIATFEVAGGERFRVRLITPELVENARRLLDGEPAPAIPLGTVVRGDPGDNAPWSWHLDPVGFSFAEVTIEVCDGIPSDVESGTITSTEYCPWSARVVALDPVPPSP